RGIGKSASLASLHGALPPSPARKRGSRAGSTAAAAQGAPAGAPASPEHAGAWALLPAVLEGLLAEDRSDTPACCALDFVEALLELVGALALAEQCEQAASRRRAGGSLEPAADFEASTAGGPGDLVSSLLQWSRCLFVPPRGLVCCLAGRLPPAAGPLHKRLAACELALFRVPGAGGLVYASEGHIAEYYVRRHFLELARFYHSKGPASGEGCVPMCRLHLQALLALASLRGEGELLRRAFQQFAVIDFLVGEVDLEHETRQMRERFLRAAQHRARRLDASSGGSSVGAGGSRGPSRAPSAGALEALGATWPVADGQLGGSRILSFSRLPRPPALAPDESAGSGRAPIAASAGSSPSSPGSGRAPPAALRSAPARGPAHARPVPALRFQGIRPSLQGCSGLGAPPPEEPGGDHDAAAGGGPATPGSGSTLRGKRPANSGRFSFTELREHLHEGGGSSDSSSSSAPTPRPAGPRSPEPSDPARHRDHASKEARSPAASEALLPPLLEPAARVRETP
ncbi:unnamed protein product, partial [Prorocentrum cordatum]